MGPLPALIAPVIGAIGTGLSTVGAAAGLAGGAAAGGSSLLGGLSTASSLISAGSTIASAVAGPKLPPAPQTPGAPTPAAPRPFQNTSLAAMSPTLALGGTQAGVMGSLGQSRGKTLLGS